jgi:hypothetical protein
MAEDARGGGALVGDTHAPPAEDAGEAVVVNTAMMPGQSGSALDRLGLLPVALRKFDTAVGVGPDCAEVLLSPDEGWLGTCVCTSGSLRLFFLYVGGGHLVEWCERWIGS